MFLPQHSTYTLCVQELKTALNFYLLWVNATSLEYRSGNEDCVHMRHVLYIVFVVTRSSYQTLYCDKVE